MFQYIVFAFLAVLLTPSIRALPQITVKGSKFFNSNGEQFFLKGVAYQLNSKDPLLDENQCRLDANLMMKLGANTIRVYHVSPSGDHSGCMNAFNDAGIYLFVDLDDFPTSINETAPQWTTTQERAYEQIMDEFQQYDNTAGFFISNEAITKPNTSEIAVLVKAATRDLKAYRDNRGYRSIPIGYSHADISELRPNLQNYLACGSNRSESIDFFGLNAYEWCGSHTYQDTGYPLLQSQAEGYPIPIFFSETGCIHPEPRLFQDQNAIFGPEMEGTWSGAIVYEWIQEVNHYGLIAYGDYTDALNLAVPSNDSQVKRSGTPTPVTPDFTNLMNVWKTAIPSSTSEAEYSPSLTPPPCPAFTSGVWEVNPSAALPPIGTSLDAAAQASIDSGTAPTGTPGAATPSKELGSLHYSLAGIIIVALLRGEL